MTPKPWPLALSPLSPTRPLQIPPLAPGRSPPSPASPLRLALSAGPVGVALTSSCRVPPDGATRRPGRARSSGSAAESRLRPS